MRLVRQVAGDQSAYLQLDGTSAYAKQQSNGGELVLDFTGKFGQNGSGLNTAAETEFDDVFEIRNSGTQEVNVWVARNEYATGGAESVQIVTGGGDGTLVSDEGPSAEVDIGQPPSRSASGISPGGESGDGLSANGPDVQPGGYVVLGAGDAASIGLNFFVNEADPQTWNKEWQFNASTSAPTAGDYDDPSLTGHPDI